MQAYHKENQDFEELNLLLQGITTSFLDAEDSILPTECADSNEGTTRLNTYMTKPEVPGDVQSIESTDPIDFTDQDAREQPAAKPAQVLNVSQSNKEQIPRLEISTPVFRSGMIFKASSKTYNECLSRMLLGLPSNQWER